MPDLIRVIRVERLRAGPAVGAIICATVIAASAAARADDPADGTKASHGPPASSDPSPEPPPVDPPTAEELDILTGELALLDRAATRRVTVPTDARTLRELIESLSAQAEIPVDADWDDLVSLGISPDDPPAFSRGTGSLLAVLDSLCLSVGVPFARPQPEAMIGRIRLVAPATVAEMRRTRVYHADTLADDFMIQATEHIDAEGWLRNGGDRQHATSVAGALLVSAPASVHRRLEALLEELRMTRPAAVELSADVWRVPAAAWRELAMSPAAASITPASLASMAGVERIASPTLVTSIDQEAAMETTNAAMRLRLSFRPERHDDAGVLVRFELVVAERGTNGTNGEADESGSRAMSQGTIPAPVAGPPALLSVDLPGGERTLVLFLRARPLARGAAASRP